MIKFFRRIRQTLLSENKFSAYMLYAVGEIVLVVVGILIALAVSDWSKNLNEKGTEQRLLSGLQHGLIKDKTLLEDELIETNQALKDLRQLDSLLKLPVPTYDDQVNSLFGTVYGMRTLNLNRALYEDLKSSGLGIVRNEDLKSRIIDVFENDYVSIDGLKINERSINDVSRPYYLANFVSIRFAQYAKPIDLENLWKDPYYQNIVYYRLVTLDGNQRIVYENSIENINTLLELLGSYLEGD